MCPCVTIIFQRNRLTTSAFDHVAEIYYAQFIWLFLISYILCCTIFLGTKFSQCEKSVPNPHTCDNLVPNPQSSHMKNCYQILTHASKWYQRNIDVKNWYFIFTDKFDVRFVLEKEISYKDFLSILGLNEIYVWFLLHTNKIQGR